MTKAGKKIIGAAKSLLELIKETKAEDPREPRRGYARGGYLCHCLECDCNFTGDKRAYRCADCAYAD
jgi:hypothetical protein